MASKLSKLGLLAAAIERRGCEKKGNSETSPAVATIREEGATNMPQQLTVVSAGKVQTLKRNFALFFV